MEKMYDPTLGRRLAVCKANPGTLFIFAIPGLIVTFWLIAGVKVALEAGTISNSGSITTVCILVLLMVLCFLPVLVRARDRAEFFEGGFRFKGREYVIADCKDIAIQHRGSAYIRLLDKTVVTFQYQGRRVRLATRTLRDFSQQLHRCYGSGV